jgi:hypothetical protein
MLRKISAAVAAAVALWCGTPSAASAQCVPINSAADLNLIRKNLAGQYCLTQSIELKGKFEPIGSLLSSTPFTGSLDGRGHVIRGLTINDAKDAGVGLFSFISGGKVSNLTLAAVSVKSSLSVPDVGALAGLMIGGEINNVHVSGELACGECRVGGIVGELGNAVLRNSSSTASVKAGHGGAAGGAVGQMGSNAIHSFATGRVSCMSHCVAGGFVGEFSSGVISQSFAAGRVSQGRAGIAGGLVGRGTGTIVQSYSTSAVSVINSTAGGLAGSSDDTRQSFAVGRVSGGTGSYLGGLTAIAGHRDVSSYWDADTTQQSFSPTGQPRTTVQMRATLPAGFVGNVWGITKRFSYPYLDVPGLAFSASLATVVNEDQAYTFLPIDQHEPTEYRGIPRNMDDASLAAVYTMIARAIGTTRDNNQLEAIPINRYFWNDGEKRATWQGPVTDYANLRALTTLPNAATINNSNILGALKRGDLAILRGSLATGEKRWMLATLFRTNGANVATHVVANDPWTGKQVLINVNTRRVTTPDFPQPDLKVDAYRAVQLK